MSERRSKKKLLLFLVVLFVLGLGGAGFFFIYKSGLKREGIFDQARRAMKEKRYEDAIRFAKETLVSDPEAQPARMLLLHALIESDKVEEAKKVAEEYWADGTGDVFAGHHLCQLAMNERRYDEAERIALVLTDKEPAIAYQLLAFIPDMRGLEIDDVRSRIAAADTMRDSASIVEHPTHKATSLLFSASVLLEVAPYFRLGGKETAAYMSIMARARETLSAAAGAANTARTHDHNFNYDVVMGSIRALSEDQVTSELGAKMLQPYIDGVLRDEGAISTLVKYYLQREEWDTAVELAGTLKKSYWWLRTYWVARASGNLEIAMRMIETAPVMAERDRLILRADALLRHGERDKAREALTTVLSDAESNANVTMRALLRYQTAFGIKEAVAMAEEVKLADRADTKLKALLASLMLAGEGADERGLSFVRELVGSGAGKPAPGGCGSCELSRKPSRVRFG